MKKITYLTLILCAFAALSGCRKKDEYYSNERPISEYKAVDVTTFSDVELITTNVEDMNKDNALDIISSYYGLELTIPDAWSVKEASGLNLNDTDTRCTVTFTNTNEEERDEFISEFYDDYHLGDDKLDKFKTNDGYSWVVQIKGVSIKDTYTFKTNGNDLTFIIENIF